MIKRTFALLSIFVTLSCAQFDQEYLAIQNSTDKKEAFFEILTPLIYKSNQAILKERQFIQAYFFYKKHLWLDAPTKKRFENIAKTYRIEKKESIEPFMLKIDTIPVCLALAQAATESAWGSSYFVKEANNLFGEWTWGDKGIVPRNREPGKKHKIRIFDTLQESVNSYMKNLNRHYAYKKLRTVRAKYRKEGKIFDGIVAANYLQSYSGIGHNYTKLLHMIIKHNKLGRFCKKKD